MIKILHCADVHLDSPFAAEDIRRAEVRRNELRGAFTSMMTYVKMSHIDLLLIAGDLFDRDFVTRETMMLVTREFASVPDCEIVISPGNHDPYVENSPWARCKFSENVHIFNTPSLGIFTFDKLGCEVYGYAFTAPSMDACPAVGRKPRRQDYISILLAHADMTSPVSNTAPLTEGDIEESGFDYVALGHIHNSSGVQIARNTRYAYSGCLEGRDFGECGYKGALAGSFNKTNGVFNCDIKGVRFSKRRYADEKLNVTGAASADDLVERIHSLITAKKYGEDTQLRVTLEGSVNPALEIREKALSAAFPELFSLDLIDSTTPNFDAQQLERDLSIRGAFWAELKPLLESSDKVERERAASALRVGLAALAGADIADFD